jgi:alpha-glucosidase
VYAKRDIIYSAVKRSVTVGTTVGSFSSPVKQLKFVLHGLGSSLEKVNLDGTSVSVHSELNTFFKALEKFDPFYDPEPAPSEPVLTLTVPYTPAEITLSW